MEKNDYKFVKTTDEETAEYLRKAGFVELAKEQNRWVFINDLSKADFSQSDMKLNFDNKLMF